MDGYEALDVHEKMAITLPVRDWLQISGYLGAQQTGFASPRLLVDAILAQTSKENADG
jgi:hypothetical protein